MMADYPHDSGRSLIISGIAPGKGGVGALVKSIDLKKDRFNYDSIYIKNPRVSINVLLNEKKLISFAVELISWFWSFFTVQIRMFFLRNNRVILIYPQYFSNYILTSLIKNNDVALYVMDNSFFCIKSYNFLTCEECLRCVDSVSNIDESCVPNPKLWSKKSSIKKVKRLKAFSQHIYFLSQNHHQFLLLKRVFGEEIKGRIVGMDTGEFCQQSITCEKNGYDIVYHGANNNAKGIAYVLELAKYLKQYSFLIPTSICESKHKLPNVHFECCTWSSGLKGFVSSAKLVLCPSIWSSPVEGSLLKSIAYNGNVAVYDNQYGFQNDIKSNALLRLNDDVRLSSKIIDDFIKFDCDNSLHAKEWLKYYCSNLDEKDIFEWSFTK